MKPTVPPRIIALNLPAGLDEEIAGNPVITRLEAMPANCFPGLDVDVRNLDRRFFPGLVFNFKSLDASDPQVQSRGALLMSVDATDPDLPAEGADELKKQLADLSSMLPGATILLDSISLESGNEIRLLDDHNIPFDWDVTWRIVRSLEPGPLTIGLSRFDRKLRVPLMKLKGRRRIFQKSTGELSIAYQAGELSQSLCSPWQHDFRDCSCTYWASNHPDIVLAAHPSDIAEFDDEGSDQERAEDPVVWLRWDRERQAAPRPTGDGSRALEMDHYEINHRWKELSIVLGGREQLVPWTLSGPADSEPDVPLDPIEELKTLTGMEQALALEYLYARYTVRFYETSDSDSLQHAKFIAHGLLNIAIGEMQHLHWANELLMEFQRLAGLKAEANLRVGLRVPFATLTDEDAIARQPHYHVKDRPAQERPLDEAIDDFVAAELPSGTLNGKYAGLLVLLKRGWPKPGEIRPHLIELVERIAAEGVEHYERFREIQALLKRPGGQALVTQLKNMEEDSPEFVRAERLYRSVADGLLRALNSGWVGEAAAEAHEAMRQLDQFAQESAIAGLAIPFLTIAKAAARLLP